VSSASIGAYGSFVEDGRVIGQHPRVEFSLASFLDNHGPPESVVEIGTHHGGFTAILRRLLPEATIATVEIDKKKLRGWVPRVSYIIGDATSDAVAKHVDRVTASRRPRWVFVDGGDKPKEFSVWRDRIEPGELIFVHDYDDPTSDWPYVEAKPGQLDLRGFIQLSPELARVGWGCFRRQSEDL
jgi:hypothetical protein